MMDLLFIPTANAAVDLTAFGNVVRPIFTSVIYPLIGLLFAVATIVFVYGVLQLVLKSADAEDRDSAKKSILYGVFGMFIMVSAWGIIYLISNTIKAF